MATTTTNDAWAVPFWFGSVATLADAAASAEAELSEIDAEKDRQLKTTATVEFPGGTLRAENLAELRDETGSLERRSDIESVRFSLVSPSYQVVIQAGGTAGGVKVDVSGKGASVVHGLVTTLQRKLEPGAGRVRRQPLEPFGAENYLSLVVGWAVGLGFGYWIVSAIETYGFDLGWGLFLALAAIGPAAGTSLFFSRTRPSPPRLQLVPASEEAAPPPPEDDRGPVLRARDWLRRHPVLALGGTFALAVAANLITNLVS